MAERGQHGGGRFEIGVQDVRCGVLHLPAIALFLRDLPPEVERVLGKTFTQQDLTLRLATDARFLGRARRMLAAA